MSEAMRRAGDCGEAERERLSFLVLQRAYRDAREGAGPLTVSRAAAVLGLSQERVVQIVAHLTYGGFLSWYGTGRPFRITSKGSEYIQSLASGRPPSAPPPRASMEVEEAGRIRPDPAGGGGFQEAGGLIILSCGPPRGAV